MLSGFMMIALSFILIYRMAGIGVIQHGHYLALAQNQQRFEETETASRGKILVHDSVSDPNAYYPLAFDVKSFSVWAVPNQIKDKRATASALAGPLDIPENEIFELINNNKLYIPPLKKSLNLSKADSISSKNITGIFVMPEYNRYYPEGSLASQLLGFVNSEGTGNYGVEGYYDSELKGKNGDIVGEKDTLGRMISMLSQTNPQNGTSYVLTIDRSVQYYVEKRLAQAIEETQAESGTVIVMDVATGGILTMVNNPTFDPNNYRETANTNQALFGNPAISSLYEPGSIFKPLIVSAALDSGTVTPETTNTFGTTVEVDGYTIHTAEGKAFGTENVAQILQNSDNVGMVWLADQMGNDIMSNYIQKFGFGSKSGIDLTGEESGQVPKVKNWRNINRATISFGQGVSVTPLQMVAAYGAIANNGRYIYPHLISNIVYNDGTEKEIKREEGNQIISSSTATELRAMLANDVLHYRSLGAKVQGFQVGAKTGTAQIPSPTGGYMTSPDGSNLGIFIHSVCGMAPTDDPKFVMIVKLDKPKSAEFAERTAGPLFGDITSFLLNYYYHVPGKQASQ